MWNRFCIDSGKLKMRTIRVADIWLVNSTRAENWWKFPCHSTITMCKWINVFIILFQSANRWTFEWAWCRLNVCRKIDILSITKLTSENHFWLVETFSIWFQNSLKDAYEVQLLVLFDSSNFRFKTSNSNF